LTGLAVINDSYTTQFDENFKTLNCTQHSTATMTQTSAWPTTPVQMATLSFYAAAPLIAFRCAYPAVVWKYVQDSPGHWIYYIVSQQATSGTSLEYWIFEPILASQIATPSVGLEVYNASGELTFSSEMKFLKITDTPVKAAVIQCLLSATRIVDYNPDLQNPNPVPGHPTTGQTADSFKMVGAAVNGNTVSYSLDTYDFITYWGTPDSTEVSWAQTPTSYILVDVSGY
jgi:hypothetical protein